MNRFFNNYEIKDGKEIIDKFAKATHNDKFYPEYSTEIFLEIINKDRKEKLKKVDLERYILPNNNVR